MRDRFSGKAKMRNESLDSLDRYLRDRKERVDRALDGFLPGEGRYPEPIFQSVRYSMFAGGKRLRPVLVIAAAEICGAGAEDVLPVACAIEMIHTYSLIHDDLPAMDDDDFRRGKPTNHRVFGEALAILAGDALLTEAFRLMTDRRAMKGIPPERLLAVSGEVAEAAGFSGMIAGQTVDIASEGKPPDKETLEFIHSRKTERMITVSLRAGAILAGAGAEALEALTGYGRRIGLAFQISDDILNVEGTVETLGKGTGSDAARKKMTYPALYGLEASKEKARVLAGEAVRCLDCFGREAQPLRSLAGYIVERNH